MHLINSEIKNILCIKPRGIGDVILSTIVLDNLHNHFKNAKIDYLTEEFVKPSIDGITLINNIITIKKNEFVLNIAKKIRKNKYDLILDFWSNPRSAQITFLSGVKKRVGYNYRGRSYAYNIKVNAGRGDNHSAEHNLELLKAIGVSINSKKIYVSLDKDENKVAKEFIKKKCNDEKIKIAIVPAGGWESKKCDAEKWVNICNKISKNLNAIFIIIWGPGDELDAQLISNNLKTNSILTEKTTIVEMTALINNCDIIIANDSGPMHISAALGKPTIGLFGPTDPKKHGPYSKNSDYVIKSDLHCIICNKLKCPYNHECMLELDENEILNKIKNILNLSD